MKGFNKEILRTFIQRRKINALALLSITLLCALITIVCAVTGFPRTDILGLVTILLVVLCFVQEIKLRKGDPVVQGVGEEAQVNALRFPAYRNRSCHPTAPFLLSYNRSL